MSNVKIKRVLPSTLAKVFSLYSFFVSLLIVVVDLFVKVFSGESIFVGLGSYGSWALFVLIYVVLSLIVAYIIGLIVGFLINLALKTTGGIEIETE